MYEMTRNIENMISEVPFKKRMLGCFESAYEWNEIDINSVFILDIRLTFSNKATTMTILLNRMFSKSNDTKKLFCSRIRYFGNSSFISSVPDESVEWLDDDFWTKKLSISFLNRFQGHPVSSSSMSILLRRIVSRNCLVNISAVFDMRDMLAFPGFGILMQLGQLFSTNQIWIYISKIFFALLDLKDHFGE